MKIGFSMVSSCELAFIISVNAWIEGLISDDTFDALIMASLVSILVSPLMLRRVLLDEASEKQREIDLAKEETHIYDDEFEDAMDGMPKSKRPKHHIYFQLQTKSHGQFGHQDRLLKAIFDLNMSIIDFRSFHPHGTFQVHVVNEMYLRDNSEDSMIYDISSTLEEDSKTVATRMEALYKAAKSACDEDSANIKVYRWMPGADNSDGGGSGRKTESGKSISGHTGVTSPPSLSRASSQTELKKKGPNIRERSSSGGGGGSPVNRESRQPSLVTGEVTFTENRLDRRGAINHEELLQHLDMLAYIQAEKEFQKKQKHHVGIAASMASHSHPGELVHHVRHHELDGFVHSDPHDAFDPDDIEGEVFSSDSESSDDESVGGLSAKGINSGYVTPKEIETQSHRASFKEEEVRRRVCWILTCKHKDLPLQLALRHYHISVPLSSSPFLTS